MCSNRQHDNSSTKCYKIRHSEHKWSTQFFTFMATLYLHSTATWCSEQSPHAIASPSHLYNKLKYWSSYGTSFTSPDIKLPGHSEMRTPINCMLLIKTLSLCEYLGESLFYLCRNTSGESGIVTATSVQEQIQQDLSKHNKLFSKDFIELSKVIGQGKHLSTMIRTLKD